MTVSVGEVPVLHAADKARAVVCVVDSGCWCESDCIAQILQFGDAVAHVVVDVDVGVVEAGSEIDGVVGVVVEQLPDDDQGG